MNKQLVVLTFAAFGAFMLNASAAALQTFMQLKVRTAPPATWKANLRAQMSPKLPVKNVMEKSLLAKL